MPDQDLDSEPGDDALETNEVVDEPGDGHEDPAPLTREDLGSGSPASSTRVRVALLVVAAILVGFLIARATSGGDDGGGSDDEAADGADVAADEGGVPFPTGDQNRTGYWGFVDLTPIVQDTFDRENDPESLGDAGDGGTWDPVSGTWGIREDSATTSGGQGDGPFLAVVAGGGRGDGLTEVTMTTIEDGSGLVFRYLDPQNHWSITPSRSIGSWVVNRTIDGETEEAAQFAGATSDNVTISVEQKGSNLRFLIDGQEIGSLVDGALGEQLQGGLTATGTNARWNRFLVLSYATTDAGGATTTTAAG